MSDGSKVADPWGALWSRLRRRVEDVDVAVHQIERDIHAARIARLETRLGVAEQAEASRRELRVRPSTSEPRAGD